MFRGDADSKQNRTKPYTSVFHFRRRAKGVLFLKKKMRDFPGGPVVRNPPANAGDRFDPWFRKIK